VFEWLDPGKCRARGGDERHSVWVQEMEAEQMNNDELGVNHHTLYIFMA
jgi:hypothetical protein